MQVGCKWTYKLRLQESDGGNRSALVLGTQTFDTDADARAAGETHLKAELEKRSKGG